MWKASMFALLWLVAGLTLLLCASSVHPHAGVLCEELQEIFSQKASRTFRGDITVSTFDYELEGKLVQALLFRPPGDEKKPALLLVPGYQRTAIDYIGVGLAFARAGYVGLAVTQPGFGRSEGLADTDYFEVCLDFLERKLNSPTTAGQ